MHFMHFSWRKWKFYGGNDYFGTSKYACLTEIKYFLQICWFYSQLQLILKITIKLLATYKKLMIFNIKFIIKSFVYTNYIYIFAFQILIMRQPTHTGVLSLRCFFLKLFILKLYNYVRFRLFFSYIKFNSNKN